MTQTPYKFSISSGLPDGREAFKIAESYADPTPVRNYPRLDAGGF